MRKGIGPQNLGAPGSSPITKNYSLLKKLSDPGDKYKKGDLIDETDHEEQVYSTTNKNEYSDKPGAGLNVENISEIQEDKKGQYMTTLDEKEFISSGKKKTVSNYNVGKNVPRDTLRPKKGKFFKRGY